MPGKVDRESASEEKQTLISRRFGRVGESESRRVGESESRKVGESEIRRRDRRLRDYCARRGVGKLKG